MKSATSNLRFRAGTFIELLEKLVKLVDKDQSPEPNRLKPKLEVFDLALRQAIEVIQPLIPAEAENTPEPGAQQADDIPEELARNAAAKLRGAAEIGDITDLISIADEIKSGFEPFEPYRDKIARMAEDFDFDGILQLADELERFEK